MSWNAGIAQHDFECQRPKSSECALRFHCFARAGRLKFPPIMKSDPCSSLDIHNPCMRTAAISLSVLLCALVSFGQAKAETTQPITALGSPGLKPTLEH